MGDSALRLDEESLLISEFFASARRSGHWFLVPDDTRARRLGWTPDPFPVAFHAQERHPGEAPYGIFVPSSARVNGRPPDNFESTSAYQPPFEGNWGVLSWSCDPWIPKAQIREGANLLNFLLTFEHRFRQGV